MEENRTIAWYEKNASEYCQKTENADMHYAYQRFLEDTFKGAEILDFGCGSGRDAKYFLTEGMKVSACDGSPAMVAEASQYTGLPVTCMKFQNLHAEDRYDGIWASASLLHLPYEQLNDVFAKMMKAIHKEGIIYMSFRYGTFEGYREDRWYTDLDINKAAELILPHRDALLLECWKSHDSLNRDLLWLNLIVRKVTPHDH